MVDVAKVNMYGHPVGTFSWDGRYERFRFEYDHGFIGQGLEPSPLMIPVREGRVYSFGNLDKETFRGLPGMLADSLPDTYGRALFDRWLVLTGRTSSNPIGTLCFWVSIVWARWSLSRHWMSPMTGIPDSRLTLRT